MSKKSIKIYLSGSIAENPLNPSNEYWTKEDEKHLLKIFSERDIHIEIMNPNNAEFQKRKDLYNHEMDFIKNCSFILVDLSERRGIGVGIEIYHAFLNQVPIYGICPDYSYYKNSANDYIHPYVSHIVTEHFLSKKSVFEFLKSI